MKHISKPTMFNPLDSTLSEHPTHSTKNDSKLIWHPIFVQMVSFRKIS